MSEPDEVEVKVPDQNELPGELPVLPLRDTVVFPDTMIPLTVGQERSIRLIDEVLAADRLLVLVASKDAEIEVPGPDLLYQVGTVALAHKMVKLPDNTMRILVQGLQRVTITGYTTQEPYLKATIEKLDDVIVESKEVDALRANLLSVFSRIVSLVPYLPEELEMAAANVEEPGALAFLVASTMRIKTEDKQELLEEPDIEQRLRKLTRILARELEVLELGSKIQSDVRSEIDKTQREYFLRQQLKAIQQELGETNEQEAEANELRAKLDQLVLPDEVRKAAEHELERLGQVQSASAEYPVIRTYLDWIVTLPWNISSDDNLDIKHAREILDRDHYDLEKVKDRILEYLAVRKLKSDLHGPILCFVGPPGVGKTSLGRSIAEAMGRKFERISVGGVRDEAEIRGHRRTYVGAMPGIILRAMRDAGTDNPLFMIDEIDKMGADWRGDPSSAMLEVLDPEQNYTFRDHYLDLPFDLSKVMFITTANQLEPIPGPLRDRMEIINLAGYTIEEKLHIARHYLVPKQVAANGLRPSQVAVDDAAIREIITSYTVEAGVRNLEREIGSVCRKLARRVAENGGGRRRFKVGPKRVHELLGRPRVFAETKRRTADAGVATGLAWTPVGGDILFIEATSMPGSGHLTVTGQLGDVMKESAQAAVSYVRAHSVELGLPDDYFAKRDMHIHVPAGAIPKDGPSAGVTMATAVASLVTGLPVSADVAMTGEVTLTGQVLPIGGLKEKTLAAQRAGITTVILPARNEADLEDVPEELRKGMTFVPVERVEQVWRAAMGLTLNGRPALRRAPAAAGVPAAEPAAERAAEPAAETKAAASPKRSSRARGRRTT
ncbi:MAG: endopeptidase La [Thermoleophilia bacterium]